MTDPTASAARDDLAFLRTLVSDSGRVQASTGATLLAGGLCYGAQCLAQGLIDVSSGFPGRDVGQLIAAVLPTLVFVVVVTRVSRGDRRNRAGVDGGVASRAFRTAFRAMGLSILVTGTVFGYVAVREHDLSIWLFHPIMVCVAQGVGWYMAFTIRRRTWFAVVSGCLFASALLLTALLHDLDAFIFVLGAVFLGLMAIPGWLLWRSARVGA